MNNAQIHAFEVIGPLTRDGEVRLRPRPQARTDQRTRIAITAFLTAVPALAGVAMWVADPHGMAAFHATRTGQILFYTSFIWVGIGMLEIRRMVLSRAARRLRAPAR